MNKVEKLKKLKISDVGDVGLYNEIVYVLINDLLDFCIQEHIDFTGDFDITFIHIDYYLLSCLVVGDSIFYRYSIYKDLIFKEQPFPENKLESFDLSSHTNLKDAIDSYIMCSLVKSVVESNQVKEAMLITNRKGN